MPVVSLRDIVDPALEQRYGVPAINIVNDLTLAGVLEAAVEERSPLIVQTSVKTVRSVGSRVLYAMWTSMTAGIEVPVSLHLDHCPDRAVITECLEVGWNSVLFDASRLAGGGEPAADGRGRRRGPPVRRPRRGRDRIDHRRRGRRRVRRRIRPADPGGVGAFIARPGWTSSPRRSATRTAMYKHDADAGRPAGRPTSSRRTGVPIALHGGSGLTDEQFRDLIARGCAKVNISTALKRHFMQSSLAFLKEAESATSGIRRRCSRPSGADTGRNDRH